MLYYGFVIAAGGLSEHKITGKRDFQGGEHLTILSFLF
jgi:hypothetical protein